MHAERAERLPALHDEVADLQRVVSRFRWRLGLERLLVAGVRGLAASAVAVVGLSVASWLFSGVGGTVTGQPWLVTAPVVVALGWAVLRWPSNRQAALAADRRLVLDERLGTAIELAARARGREHDRASGRLDHLQLRDAIEHATSARGEMLALDRRTTREALLASTLVLLAAGSLLLPGLPRPSLPAADHGLAEVDAALPDSMERSVPSDAPDITVAESQTLQQQSAVRADPDLAARVQQEQAERDALNNLSQALGRLSAAQPAADAIQQGDFSAARQQLSNLGDEADQLSDAAKQQLSRALQQAANTTAGDRQLADREHQAAQALARSSYTEQRQALRNLADQVERSGERSVPADQLAHDVGQLEQQTGGQGKPQAPLKTAPQPGASGAQTPGDAADGAAAGAQQDGASAGQGAGSASQQGGPGVGSGANSDVLGDQPSRLDSAGQSVAVPTKLGAGPGVRPADGTEDQTGNNPTTGGQSVSELVQAQQTGQVAPERNLVPGEQRPVVRGYFR